MSDPAPEPIGPGEEGGDEGFINPPHMRLVRDSDCGDLGEGGLSPLRRPAAIPENGGFYASAGVASVLRTSPILPSPVMPVVGGGRSPVGASELARELEALRTENEQLRAEVHHLRRRDDTVNYTINRIDEELRLAAKLQRDFMPRTLPALGRIRFHTLYRPAGYVSGDLYDISRLDEHHVGFYMADAVGHGMPAALLTMFMRQALQTKEIADNSYRLLRPSETLSRMNSVMVEQDLSQATFATAVCGVINADTGSMLVSSAGHPRPIVVPRSGDPYELPTEGSLLGIFGEENYSDVQAQLEPGDRLVIYTDGVEVAFRDGETEDGSPLFDPERWKSEMLQYREESAEQMLLRLSAALDMQTGSLCPSDDLTIIVVDVLDR